MTSIVDLGDGRRASYEVIGEGPPALVFVGGPGLPAAIMRPDACLFSDRFSFYLIDPPGSGSSTPPAESSGYDHVGHAGFYDAARVGLGLSEVSVWGWSFGGTVALTHAALYPGVVRQLVVVGAFAMGTEVDESEGGAAAAETDRVIARHAGSAWFEEAKAVWESWTERVLQTDDPEEVARMLVTVLPLYTAQPDRPKVRAHLDEAGSVVTVDLAAAKAWEGGLYQTIDIRSIVARVQAPTLVVAGALDLIGGPSQARAIADALPRGTLRLVAGAGHMPAWEEPAKLRRIVEAWLDAEGAGAG